MRANLAQIVADTRGTIPGLQQRRRELELAAAEVIAPTGFSMALLGSNVSLIAEVKRRSPSAGEIRSDLDPSLQASHYARGGARAISVLTDGPHFGGSAEDLRAVSRAVLVPTLRKDFILDELQILEARSLGASAVLLIVRILEPARLKALHAFARSIGLGTLVETHSAAELDAALAAGAEVVGVNSRDLDTFAIDVASAWALLGRVPREVIAVAESGMATRADVERAAAAGADAVLIGGALSASTDPAALAGSLSGVPRVGR